MITSYNKDNAQKYNDLFAKANTILSLSAEDTIGNLNQYFGEIEKIRNAALDSQHPELMRLPMDEEFFEINANTREIKIPSVFATGVGIAGDNQAETIYFIVDRYFDTQDLNNLNIAIEYITASGNHGYSRAIFKDARSMADKLIFGWSINDQVTESHGRISFAVRFFSFGEQNGRKIIDYSLSTKPTTIMVNKSLYSDGKISVSLEALQELIDNTTYEAELLGRLKDSTVYDENIIVKKPIILASVGEGEKDFDGNGKIKLYLVASGVNVSYTLSKKSDDGLWKEVTKTQGDYVAVSSLSGLSEDEVKQLTRYIKNDNGVYEIYEEGKQNETAAPVELFVRAGQFEIDETKDGVGEYRVYATDTIRKVKENSDPEAITVPGPAEPVLVLPQDAGQQVLPRGGNVVLSADVTVAPKNKLAYKWSHNGDLVGSESSLRATQKGAYTVSVTSERNGVISEPHSAQYYVDYSPIINESVFALEPNTNGTEIANKKGTLLKTTINFPSGDGASETDPYFDAVHITWKRRLDGGEPEIAPDSEDKVCTKQDNEATYVIPETDNNYYYFFEAIPVENGQKGSIPYSSKPWLGLGN